MDTARGEFDGFATAEERDAMLARFGVGPEKVSEMSREFLNPIRRLPVPFDVGEKLVIKGGHYEVEKIEKKRLTLKPLARP